jgi:hypothetical protein
VTAARKGPGDRGRGKRASREPQATRESDRDARTITLVVDRREGDVLVVVNDAGHATDVPSAQLPAKARREGMVLRVPVGDNGEPRWTDAVRDRAEERRRRALLEEQVKRLAGRDKGSDIVL